MPKRIALLRRQIAELEREIAGKDQELAQLQEVARATKHSARLESVAADMPTSASDRAEPLFWAIVAHERLERIDRIPVPAISRRQSAQRKRRKQLGELIAATDKKATKRPRKSDARDRETLASLRRSRAAAAPAAAPLVVPIHSTSSLTTESSKTERASVPGERDSASRHPSSFPPWRDTTERLQLDFFHQATGTLSTHPQTISLRLSPSLMASLKSSLKAPDNMGLLASLHKHVSRHLNRALGRKVDFWLILDIGQNEAPHLHGGVALDEGEADLARDALLKAAGITKPSFRGHALDMKPPTNEAGWASYVTGNLGQLRKLTKGKSFISATNNVRREAKRLYEAARAVHRAVP